MGSLAAKRFEKSSRSSIRATVVVRVRRRTSAKSSLPSHSLLKRSSVRSASMIVEACSK